MLPKRTRSTSVEENYIHKMEMISPPPRLSPNIASTASTPTWKRLLKVGSTWAVTAADSMRTPLASSVRSWLAQSTNRRWMGDTSLRRRTTGIARGSWVVGGLSHCKRPPTQAGRVGGCVLARRTGRSWTVALASATTRPRTMTSANRWRCGSQRRRRQRRRQRRWRSRRRIPSPIWTNYGIQV